MADLHLGENNFLDIVICGFIDVIKMKYTGFIFIQHTVHGINPFASILIHKHT